MRPIFTMVDDAELCIYGHENIIDIFPDPNKNGAKHFQQKLMFLSDHRRIIQTET